jgi:RecJ-like exonuclease
LRGRGRQISEYKSSLVYRVSFRTARTTQRKTCLEKVLKKKKSRVWGEGFVYKALDVKSQACKFKFPEHRGRRGSRV